MLRSVIKKISLVFVLLLFVSLLDARPDKRSSNDQSLLRPGQINHVIWVWFENREATQITAQTAPFFTSFAAANANLTNYFGITHPSQPNYVDAFSGADQGIVTDGHTSLPATVDNIAKQLTAAGKSWRVFAQDYPGNCFDMDSSIGGVDGPGVAGEYVRKHNPAMSFQSITGSPTECAKVLPLSSFDPMVNFSLVIPNQTNDMHDGTTAQGDAFLQAFVPLVTGSPDFAHTLLIVTFDEGTTNTNGGGHIYTAAAAPWLAGKTVAATYNHFSLLRTTEDIFGLPHLGGAATASTISELFPPVPGPVDFDGDGKTDISIFRPSVGEWWYSGSSDGQVRAAQFGAGTDIPVPGDFTGDGKTDIAFWRPSTGFWFVLRSEDGSFFSFPFGTNGDIPMPADFDGDGKTDAAIFRPSEGNWYIPQSSGAGTLIFHFGSNGDQPVAADYDGDGRADIAIVRDNLTTGNKEWWIQRSTAGIIIFNFGVPGDKTVPGDYTGDGKTDVAFFRPSSGFWFVLRSEDFSFFSFPWGTAGDVPAPGDYDGDGKFDATVFRPSSSTWFVLRTGGQSPLIAGFGLPPDRALPGVYVR
jgi:hypothetical protein